MSNPTPFEVPGAKAQLFAPSPTWAGVPAAMVGKWVCKDPVAGTGLLHQITAEAKTRGYAALLGPMDGDTWNSYRLVVETDGSSPFLMEPTLQGVDVWAGAGFAPVAHYFSARAPLPEGPAGASEVQITAWDGTHPEARFAEIYDLSAQAFAGNLFYTPTTRAAFVAQYMPYVPVLKPELVLFARDSTGALTGFLFGVPNYSGGPTNKAVILKTYAGLKPGVGRALVDQFHATARAMGFSEAIHALIHDDNRSAERSRQAGGIVFRRYALMGKRL